MKARSYRSEQDRLDIVTLEVSDIDRSKVLDSREILLEARSLIAREIATRIMEKLGPALDAAISGKQS